MSKLNRKDFGKNKLPIMPSINDYGSRAEWENDCWHKIAASKDLLELLSTSGERHDLVMRAAAIDAITSGKSYKQIGNELWLSPQTISGIKKALTENNYRSYPKRKERKKRVYSRDPKAGRARPRGRRVKTKYGTLYIP
ncbi:MAG TPA: hypothetical protein VMV71_03895 [Candidatus Paceibacterota bacterium]|nr:hypothetical protein [Candidatus Paceibacterota bacterium]